MSDKNWEQENSNDNMIGKTLTFSTGSNIPVPKHRPPVPVEKTEKDNSKPADKKSENDT